MENSIECPLAGVLAQRLRNDRDQMTKRWLDRIAARVTVDRNHIFPTQELLDHVPLLVDGLADYMEDPADEISAEMPVVAKAMELGELRLAQGFSAHEVLKEYEILGGILFTFLIETVKTVDEECTRSELLTCAQRMFRGIAVIQQITTTQYLRIADEEMHEREERLRNFNRTLTHELKNRIAAVGGASSMLTESWVDSDAEQRGKFIGIIARNAAEMQNVLEDLLTLSRMDGDARQQRNVLLPEAVAEAARQLREMAADRGVEIRTAEDIPPVEVDAAAVELCLANYISNGIKYSDPESQDRWVEVRAQINDGTDGDGEVLIEVHDNGVGIPDEAREQVFERFFRADATSAVDGTGLGLSIVRETAESLGGRAWVEEKQGDETGSIFKISLPARRSADGDEAE